MATQILTETERDAAMFEFAAVAPQLSDRELSELMNAVNKVLTQRPSKRTPTRKQASGFVPLTDEQRAEMTDAQIHAHYKKTAHIEDVRFNIRHGIIDAMPAELQDAWRELLRDAENGLKRTETHKRLWALSARWGVMVLDRERKDRPGLSFSEWGARAIAAGITKDTYRTMWPPTLEEIEQAERKNAARTERRAS